jgi:hypothetical protein
VLDSLIAPLHPPLHRLQPFLGGVVDSVEGCLIDRLNSARVAWIGLDCMVYALRTRSSS